MLKISTKKLIGSSCLITFQWFLGSTSVSGQVKKPEVNNSNAVYFELGGNSLLYSVNYEKIIGSLGFRLGYGTNVLFKSGDDAAISLLPAEFLYLIGKYDSKLELGAGFTYLRRNDHPFIKNEHYIVGRVGYRYENSQGFLFKVGFTPMYFIPQQDVYSERKIWPYAGISFGQLIL